MHKIDVSLSKTLVQRLGNHPQATIIKALESMLDDYRFPSMETIAEHTGTCRVDFRMDHAMRDRLRKMRRETGLTTTGVVVCAVLRQLDDAAMTQSRRQANATGDAPASNTKCPSGAYMSDKQLAWFRYILQGKLGECEASIQNTESRDQSPPEGDEADIADHKIQAAQQNIIEARLHDRRREIMAAISRIDSGDYGFCADTGEEIGLPRLVANPMAILCIDAQERREMLGRFR